MAYSNKRLKKAVVLDRGYYQGYQYFILNLGTHPTAYVVLEKEHPLFGKDWQDLEYIRCHYGLNYSNSYLLEEKHQDKMNDYLVSDKWVLGWSYDHFGDWAGHFTYNENVEYNNKKWTTLEIYDNVIEVIEQLKEFKNDL